MHRQGLVPVPSKVAPGSSCSHATGDYCKLTPWQLLAAYNNCTVHTPLLPRTQPAANNTVPSPLREEYPKSQEIAMLQVGKK